MNQRFFRVLAKRWMSVVSFTTVLAFFIGIINPVYAMEAVRNGPLPQPLPLFPSDNWWNLDISSWPVDPNSSSYLAFINNGGTCR
ncbi:MAG TPA: hypothetical protein VFM35_13050, partial [Candidatus Binatia bacterium]|nr:hypothetical protein [Candidatus Binatia bacterium]